MTEVHPSRIHGVGVFAVDVLAQGEVILAIDDSRVVDACHPLCVAAGDRAEHCDYLPDGTTVLMQEPERYINHSCNPNAFVYSVDRVRILLAMRNIGVGDEIVYDYAVNASTAVVMDCRCGAANCRGRHVPAFFALPRCRQLALLPYLDPWFAAVNKANVADLLHRCLG